MGGGPPGSAGVPPACTPVTCRSVSLRWCTRLPGRRERHGPGRSGAPEPLPFHPGRGDRRGCARIYAGGTPALPGGLHSMTSSRQKRSIGLPVHSWFDPDKALSAPFLRSAPPGRHADGNGLYLFVQPSGTRSWIQRLVVRGRRRELGLGSVRLVSLAEAREKALANRKLAREGGDPLAEKRRAEAMPSFSEGRRARAGTEAGRLAQPESRADLAERAWNATPSRASGRCRSRRCRGADVLEILSPIWHVKPDMAGKLRQHMRAVLEWAVAMELRLDNPCDRVGPVLGPQHKVVEHMRALPHRKVGAAIRTVRASTGAPGVKLAFEFLVLTAARWGEVRWAEWSEIDRDEGVWTLPAKRTKAKPPAPGAAVWPGAGDPGGGAGARGRSRSTGVHRPARESDRGEAAAPAAREAQDRGRAARVPIQFPGLGSRGNEPSPRGHRGGPWRMWSRTGSRRPMRARTCSSAGAGSCTIGPATWPARAEGLRPEQRSMAVRGGDSEGRCPQRVIKGSQPTQCMTLGLARGSGPFEPPTGESAPLAPPSPPPLPSPFPMTEASMAPEATATGLLRRFGELSTTTARANAL